MTKPNFVSSHDWHVQLCCQRSELHPPKRAALDQGRNRHKPDLCPRTWCAVVVCICCLLRTLALLLCGFSSSLARITSATSDVLANFSRLSTSTSLVNFFFALVEHFFVQPERQNWRPFAQRKISKHRDARRRARSTRLLV